MLDQELQDDDRRLWRHYAAAEDRLTAPSLPDEMTLAAYIDGRLSQSEAQAVEAALAASDEGRRLLGEMRQLADEPPMLAPVAVLSAAASLVKGGSVTGNRWIGGLAWAAVMMMAAGACWAGLQVGQMAGGRMVAERQAVNELNEWSGMSSTETDDVVFFMKGDR